MAQSQYATIADLKALGIPATAANFFGDAAMTAALQAASSDADDYLASAFKLPLLEWNKSLTLRVCYLATYTLYNQFGFSTDAPGDELAAKRKDEALAWLAQISKQEISPQFTDSSGQPINQAAGVFIDSDPPVGFTDRGLTNSCPWGRWQ